MKIVKSIVALLLLPLALPAQRIVHVHLSPATNQAFDSYVKSEESRMDFRPRFNPENGASNIDGGGLKSKSIVDVDHGLIHDWAGGMFVSQASVDRVLAVLRDYEKYKDYYAPEVVDSRPLSHNGDRWHTYLRLFKKNIVSATLDTEYDIEYRPLGNNRWAVISHSSKIVELSDGKPLPEGLSQGFLWRLNSYWLVEPRGDGVYIECRAISLSRDIPLGFNWLVKPIITSLPRESLKNTLEATARALKY